MRRIISSVILLGVIICSSNGLLLSNRMRSRPLSSSISMAVTQIPTQSPVGGMWSPESWKKYPIKQPPNYPDEVSLYIYIYTYS